MSENIGDVVANFRAETAAFQRSMDEVKGKVGGVSKSMAAMQKAVVSAVGGFLTFEGARRSVMFLATTAMEAEQANSRLEAAIRATGGAAGLTAKQISAMADEMERRTLFDDKDIKNSAAVLLTFKQVAGDAFGRTLEAAADLSAMFGNDLQSSITMLGKALEDPITGLTALRRVGVSFTEAERDKIKALTESNRLHEAQQVILAGVEGQVKGTADAMGAKGLTGAVNLLTDALESMAEANLAFTADKGIPEWLKDVAEKMERVRFHFGRDAWGGAGMIPPLRISLAPLDMNDIKNLRGRKKEIEDLLGKEWKGAGPHEAGQREDLRDELTLIEGKIAGLAMMQYGQDAVAAATKRTTTTIVEESDAIAKMRQSLELARMELTKGSDAAEIYRLQLAGATPEIIALAKGNQELRNSAKSMEALADQAERIAENKWDQFIAGLKAGEAATKAAADAEEKAFKDFMAHMEKREEAEARLAEAEAAKKWAAGWGHALEEIQDGFADGLERLLTGQIRNFRDFAKMILDVWAQTLAQIAAMEASQRLISIGANALVGMFGAGSGGFDPGNTVDGPLPGDSAGPINASIGSPVNASLASAQAAPAPSTAPVTNIHVTQNFQLASLDPRTHADLLAQQAGTLKGLIVQGVRGDRGFAAALNAGNG